MTQEEDLQAAVGRAERAGTVAQQANALDHLAIFYHHQRHYEKAAPVYARALALWRQILGPEHPSVGTLQLNLGQIYLHLGDLEAADPLFCQALTVFEGDVEGDDPGVVTAFESFIDALRRAGRQPQAERLAPRVQRLAKAQVVRVEG